MQELNPPMSGLLTSNRDPNSIASKSATFLALAFGMTGLIWISAQWLGARPGLGEEIVGFGSAGPALAAIFLSRSGLKVPTVNLSARLLWFGLLWAPCWVVYVVSDRLRGVTPVLSLRFGLMVGVLSAIPSWIGSGALSGDAGVRKLLRTLLFPQNGRWQAVAFFSFPAMLLVPSAILHAFGFAVIWQRRSGTLWSFAAYGALMFFRNLFFTAYFEEPGWRGFPLPCLQRRISPLWASLLVWLPWALWHAPLDVMRFRLHMWGWAEYAEIRVIFLIPITIIMTWIYNRSGGNLLCTAIFHAGMNTFPFVLPYAPPVFVLVFLWAGYAVFSDKMWRRPVTTAATRG